jgi:hypothetical protein
MQHRRSGAGVVALVGDENEVLRCRGFAGHWKRTECSGKPAGCARRLQKLRDGAVPQLLLASKWHKGAPPP